MSAQVASALCKVYTDHMTPANSPRCIHRDIEADDLGLRLRCSSVATVGSFCSFHAVCTLNHAPAWSNQVDTCTAPVTHVWHRPGKSPIACCSKGVGGNRDVRPIARPMFEAVGFLVVES